MPWAKFDDRYDDHVKVRRAWHGHPRAVGLHAQAVTWSARNRTDGALDDLWLVEKLPIQKERETVLAVLVDAGLLERDESGTYHVHDFLDYNPSREQTAARQQQDAERKAMARATSVPPVSVRSPNGHAADSAGSPGGHAAESAESLRGRLARAHRPPEPVPQPQQREVVLDPKAGGRASASGGRATPLNEEEENLAEQVRGVLQRGIDGLTTEEPATRPTLKAILATHRQHQPSADVAMAAAVDARSIAQAQDRAPNITALYAQRLAAHVSPQETA